MSYSGLKLVRGCVASGSAGKDNERGEGRQVHRLVHAIAGAVVVGCAALRLVEHFGGSGGLDATK